MQQSNQNDSKAPSETAREPNEVRVCGKHVIAFATGDCDLCAQSRSPIVQGMSREEAKRCSFCDGPLDGHIHKYVDGKYVYHHPSPDSQIAEKALRQLIASCKCLEPILRDAYSYCVMSNRSIKEQVRLHEAMDDFEEALAAIEKQRRGE